MSPEKELAAATLTFTPIRSVATVGHRAGAHPAVGKAGDVLPVAVQVECSGAVDGERPGGQQGVVGAVLERAA